MQTQKVETECVLKANKLTNIAGGICPEPPRPMNDDCLDAANIKRPMFVSLEENATANYSCPVGCFLNPSDAFSRTCIAVSLTLGKWSDETPLCTGEIYKCTSTTHA